jgi:serine/threonine-protein kinase HipA
MANKRDESKNAEVLGVYLEPTVAQSVRVGSLLRDPTGSVSFIVDESYIERGPRRPILSLAFHATSGEEDTIDRLRQRNDKMGRVTSLPPYFTNLLPEGALRSVVEAQLPPGDNNEFGMLRRLGGDLPGAVVVRDEGAATLPASGGKSSALPAMPLEDPDLVKFSLAGVQMKFSMIAAGDRLAIPAHGEGGRTIVKLPSRDYPELPEIEYGAMRLAEAVGVEIAKVSLVSVSRVEGIKESFLRPGKNVLAVQRFDRDGERRVHMEDFAQILGAVGNQKYSKANIETMVRLAARFTPDPAATVLEMVRRIVVDIMLGNGDSHLKNTSFLYADGRTPTLSPAYDIVPTIFFQKDDNLALRFNGKRAFERITPHEFERMAGYVDVSPRAVLREIKRTVERANDIWPALLRELPWSAGIKKTMAARWLGLALFDGEKNPFNK